MPNVNITQIAASDVAVAENRETFSECVTRYGSSAQIMMTLEEAGELIQAIAKTQRAMKGSGDIREAVDHLSEEIADVKIMLSQLTMIFDNDLEVAKYVHEKGARQKEQLDATRKPSEKETLGEDWQLAIEQD